MDNEHRGNLEITSGTEHFPGNERLALLHDKLQTGELTDDEKEEYDLGSEFYLDEGMGGKPWKTDAERYQRWQDLKKKNNIEAQH